MKRAMGKLWALLQKVEFRQTLLAGAAVALLLFSLSTPGKYCYCLFELKCQSFYTPTQQLREIRGYKDASMLLQYAEARFNYRNRSYLVKEKALRFLHQLPEDYEGDLAGDMFRFCATLREEKEEILRKSRAEHGAELNEIVARVENAKAKQEEKNVPQVDSPPYVGMASASIRHTTLGEPRKSQERTVQHHGQECHHMEYVWENREGITIFKAHTCSRSGTVNYINDLRSGYGISDGYYSDYTAYRNGTYKGFSGSDAFHVDEYADAEEFYYWNSDDFYDYEDAEEYFDEYG